MLANVSLESIMRLGSTHLSFTNMAVFTATLRSIIQVNKYQGFTKWGLRGTILRVKELSRAIFKDLTML